MKGGGGTYGLAKLASDTALLTTWVTSQSVLATETWGDWTLLKWVVDGISEMPESARIPLPARLASEANGAYSFRDITYGGLKYCSNTTYIPLNISVKRKKRPAWSSALSFLSSHLSGLCSLKLLGGGPAGVADLCWEVENAARAAIEGEAKARVVRMSWALGRQSIARGLVVAIVYMWAWERRR